VIEQLTRDGLRIQPFITTNASKAQAIQELAFAFERGDLHILNDPTLVSELVAYQAERLPSGILRYGAPSGGHDDTVMALALAWSAVSGQRRLIYPFPDSSIVIKEFPIPEHWARGYGMVIRGHIVAVIWGALDPESGVLYLYSEYWGDAHPAVHVAAIRARGDWITGLINPIANGRNWADGLRLIQLFADLGLQLQHADNSIEWGISELSQRMCSGRLKVFPSLSRYLGERRLYRRDERDQIVKDRDDLQEATRCLVSNLSAMLTKPVPEPSFPSDFYYGHDGWML
jgi:hypothetical protein